MFKKIADLRHLQHIGIHRLRADSERISHRIGSATQKNKSHRIGSPKKMNRIPLRHRYHCKIKQSATINRIESHRRKKCWWFGSIYIVIFFRTISIDGEYSQNTITSFHLKLRDPRSNGPTIISSQHPHFWTKTRQKIENYNQKLIENRKYLSKLDETWPESGRVDRSGDAGRRPRAKFEPRRAKKTKKITKQKK